MHIVLQPNETVVKHGFGTHFVRMMAMTGKLFLTNQRLYFVTHPLNFQRYDLSFSFGDIEQVYAKNNLHIFPQGLMVRLRDGQEHRFVVWGRKQWKAAIEEYLQ